MVVRTYFDKSNTIISNKSTNTALNHVAELFYGGGLAGHVYSRHLFFFDTTRLQSLYTGGTYTDLTKLTHTLRMTNTISLDDEFINGMYDGMQNASSFDLIAFKINQDWDAGVGYDYSIPAVMIGDPAYSEGPSNWYSAQTGVAWTNGNGVYSGSPTGITISTQHFDKGNEDIEMDITSYVNGILTGDTNFGLGLAFASGFEQLNTLNPQYVAFFTNNTQSFFEPYIETIYNNHIQDDRNNFFLDKPSKLYLYVNLAGNPTNLDAIPAVNILDYNGTLFSAFTPSQVNHVTLGVYSIDIIVPSNGNNVEVMYNDVWTGLTINGVNRPDVTLDFITKDSIGFYNIGTNDMLPKKTAVNISGIRNKEKIKRGDIRKAIVSARIPYTVEQTQNISDMKYRLYVLEGTAEYTVIDFEPIEMANNYYYFLIDTASLIPTNYFVDVLVQSNLETTTLKNVLEFEIVNQSELRNL